MIVPPRTRLGVCVLLIALWAGSGDLASRTPTRAQFASGVSLVEVYATVVDDVGEPVSGLAAQDFTVEEDGREQPIQAFASGDFPLSLAIGVDRSFSMSRDRLQAVVYAAQALLGALRPEDQVILLAIGSEVEKLTSLSVDHRAAYYALQGLQPWGTTPLYDATLSAIDAIQQAPGRRALILITDGSDRYSETSAADMIAQSRRRDVLVYPVTLQRSAPPVFAELASVTGGRSQAVGDVRRLEQSLTAIAAELRHQYLIGYVPPGRETPRRGWRSITVTVKKPGLRVRARDGYYAER